MATKTTITTLAKVAAAGAVAAGAMSIPTAPAQAATYTVAGCAAGAVCIYDNYSAYTGGHPSWSRSAYGAYNLSGQYGWKIILNNQYGGAKAQPCYGYNATNCTWGTIYQDQAYWVFMGPINSVRIFP